MTVPRWLPNLISVLRVLLVPTWVWFAEQCRSATLAGGDGEAARGAATAVLIAIGASDVLDGWLARRFGLASRVGATLDAVADKLCQVVLVTWLCVRAPMDGAAAFPPLPLWFMLVLIARDGLLLVGYVLLRRRRGRVEVVHRYHGRSASVLLFALLLMVTADVATAWVPPLVVAIALLVTASTAGYVRDGLRQLAPAPEAAVTER